MQGVHGVNKSEIELPFDDILCREIAQTEPTELGGGPVFAGIDLLIIVKLVSI